jgi:hypothetical protein
MIEKGGSAAGPKPGRVSFWGELAGPAITKATVG